MVIKFSHVMSRIGIKLCSFCIIRNKIISESAYRPSRFFFRALCKPQWLLWSPTWTGSNRPWHAETFIVRVIDTWLIIAMQKGKNVIVKWHFGRRETELSVHTKLSVFKKKIKKNIHYWCVVPYNSKRVDLHLTRCLLSPYPFTLL